MKRLSNLIKVVARLHKRSKAKALERLSTTVNLLDLPLDLIHCIKDHLELHDEFILSQVCSSLRTIFSRDWSSSISALDSEGQLKFWLAVSYHRPSVWACRACCELHRIDFLDVPRYQFEEGGSSLRPCQLAEGQEFTGRARLLVYPIRLAHAQIALKLSRLRVNLPHLQRIMSPFEFHGVTSGPLPTQWWKGDCAGVKATPKIVRGRFLLAMEWTYVYKADTFHPPVDRRYYPICTHLSWTASADACGAHGKKVEGGCCYCPTDYSITVMPTSVVMKGWFDFGTEQEPIWDIHTRSARGTRGMGKNYIPGAVRERFRNG